MVITGRRPHNKTTNEQLLCVQRHIDSFPRVEGHYIRQRSKKLYLAPDLNQSMMYRLYLECVKEKPVSERIYRQVFNSHEPPLATYVPKKDLCSLCLRYEDSEKGTYGALEESASNVLLAEWEEHKERERVSLALKAKDMNDPDPTKKTITIDLEAILQLPNAGNSEIYYKRKLSDSNFTIYDNMANGECFLWDETCGGKGCNQIASCLFKYIKSLPNEIKHLVIWADTCSAQNRNQFLNAARLHRESSRLLPGNDYTQIS